MIELRYRGTLISQILAMPIKNAMTFTEAVALLDAKQSECFNLGSFGDLPGQYGWYSLHFVTWISSLGYHIELTGEEFEPYLANDTYV